VLDRYVVIVERLPEAVPDDRLGVVQDRKTHQPALQPEVEILDAPESHLRIEPAQFVVQVAMDRQGAADQRGRFVERAALVADLPEL